jgi:hypothetical protein
VVDVSNVAFWEKKVGTDLASGRGRGSECCLFSQHAGIEIIAKVRRQKDEGKRQDWFEIGSLAAHVFIYSGCWRYPSQVYDLLSQEDDRPQLWTASSETC